MSDIFNGFSPRTIDFMRGLYLNNEKQWFEAHKEDFQKDFQSPMKALGWSVFDRVSGKYPGHGLILKHSRIYRDARRVRDGRPYRCNLWFCIEKPSEEWTATPVFWFELAPDIWSYGLGYYQAKAMTMAKLRARIHRDPAAFTKLITPLAKQSEFILDGDEYVRKKQAPSPEAAPWYNKKSFSLIHSQNNGEELYSPDLAGRIAEGFEFLMPFYEYFATLDSDPEPKV